MNLYYLKRRDQWINLDYVTTIYNLREFWQKESLEYWQKELYGQVCDRPVYCVQLTAGSAVRTEVYIMDTEMAELSNFLHAMQGASLPLSVAEGGHP